MTGPALPAPVLVGAGGAVGAVARYAVDSALAGRSGTLAVNAVGSFLLGVLSVALARESPAALALGTGFCGAFTTFSSFAVAVAEDAEAGDWPRGGAYAAGTLLLALGCVSFGRWLVGVAT